MKKTQLLVLNLFIIEVLFCSNLLAQRCAQVPVSLSCTAMMVAVTRLFPILYVAQFLAEYSYPEVCAVNSEKLKH